MLFSSIKNKVATFCQVVKNEEDKFLKLSFVLSSATIAFYKLQPKTEYNALMMQIKCKQVFLPNLMQNRNCF